MRPFPLVLLAAACSSELTVHADVETQTSQRVTVSGSTGGAQLVAYDGREAPYQLPATYDPEELTLIARHMGVHFFDSPGALVQTGGALELSIDTAALHDQGYFPFSQAYCQQVGLGSSHFILGQELNKTEVRPWLGGGGALDLAVDAQLPTSQLVVNDGTQYVARSSLVGGGDAPIFQMSFFAYLTDTRNGNTVAILFNLYDPRGPYGHGIGNDHQVFFYTTSMDPSLSSDFSIVSGAHHHEPFGWETFHIRIDADQLRSMLEQFPQEQPLSLDPGDYRLGSFGVLNEMNFLYSDPKQCLAAFDPKTSAKVDFGLRNLAVDVEPGPAAWRGANDGLSAGNVVNGWACQVGSDAPVTVRLSAGGQTLADVVAREPGESAIGQLCASGSAHRFAYAVTDAQLAAFAGQTVSGAVLDNGAPVLALQTFSGVNCALPAAMQPPAPVELTGLLEGVFIGSDNRVFVQGWACAKGSPTPAVVEVAGVDTVAANEPSEPEVAAACGEGSSGHRWSLDLSAAQVLALAGQSLGATVRDAAGTHSQTLPSAGAWPVTVPSLLGGFDGIGADGVARGWACAVGRDVPVQVTLRIGGNVLAESAADEGAEALVGTLCQGSSAHRFTVQLSPQQVAAFSGQRVVAEVDVAGGSAYTLQTYDGIAYWVP